jgi:hypothetical protein
VKKDVSPPPEVNLLELIPAPDIQWETDERGLVVLLKPKIQNHFLARTLLPKMKNPYYKIKLDKVGSSFWKFCDGKRNIKEIAAMQKNKFGEAVEPLYDRISQFLQILQKHKLITFRPPPG